MDESIQIIGKMKIEDLLCKILCILCSVEKQLQNVIWIIVNAIVAIIARYNVDGILILEIVACGKARKYKNGTMETV